MTTDMKQTIMTVARATVQARGYNALSFRELAKEVGIKSASIHYHFPTKGDLGAALARRYADDAESYFETLLGDGLDPSDCLRKYTDVFRAALLNDNRLCLCSIMVAEFQDLPAEVRREVDRFVALNLRWLARVLENAGVAPAAASARALAIYSAIGGAQLMARGRGEIEAYDRTIETYRTAGLIP